jgi:phosphate uptake regulator
METRKLQTVGGGTYTVSIPKAWANENSLEAGTDVHLFTHSDGSIIIRSSERDSGNLARARVAVDGEDPELVKRALGSAHAIGFETVTVTPVHSFNDDQRRAARSLVGTLVGTEILVEQRDEITVQNLLDASDVSIRQSVVQLQFIVLSIHRMATAALLDGESGAYERIRERDDDVDRLSEMIARHFNRSLISLGEVDRLGLSRPEMFDYYDTARQLERIADTSVKLARLGEQLSTPLAEEVAAAVRRIADVSRQSIDDATTAVLKGNDVETANEAFDGRDETRAAIDELDRRLFDESTDDVGLPTKDARVLIRALDDLARTAECSGSIAAVAIRAAIREKNL